MRWWFLLFPFSVWAIWIGNPAQPGMQTHGIVMDLDWGSLRCGYINDWVYSQELQHEEFVLDQKVFVQDNTQLATQAATVTLNIRNWVDFYGLLGGSRLKVNEEIITQSYFAWGVGGKVLFFRLGNFRAGADIKYFETDQTPQYFLNEGQAYNVELPVTLTYSETQTAVGFAYETSWFCPYAQATYLITNLDAQPPKKAYVRFPESGLQSDVEVPSSSNKTRWGMALGATLIDKKTGSLAIEWRGLNQNAIDLNAEIRF